MGSSHSPGSARIAVIMDRVRVEEKLLLQAFEARNVPVDVRDDREIVLDMSVPVPGRPARPDNRAEWSCYAAIVERSPLSRF
jgi:hypothetical protein